MSVLTVIEMDDISEHTFDSDVIEIANDKAQLKTQQDVNEVLFFNYDTDGSVSPKRGAGDMVLEQGLRKF